MIHSSSYHNKHETTVVVVVVVVQPCEGFHCSALSLSLSFMDAHPSIHPSIMLADDDDDDDDNKQLLTGTSCPMKS
jgi:hypothetical protein